MAPSRSGLRLSAFNALPETKVFIAGRGSAVVGTLTLVPDSWLGLPMDEIYRAELAGRRRHRYLGEVTSFAVAPTERADGLAVVMHLVRTMVVYAADIARLDELCIAVNPRHVDFYQRMCGFERFAPCRPYGKVNGAPAVGLVLNLDDFRARRLPLPRRVADFMFDPEGRAAVLTRLARDLPAASLTPSQFAYFFRYAEALAEVDPAKIDRLVALYRRRLVAMAQARGRRAAGAVGVTA